MEVSLKNQGVYIVAVSGGVDSMVLLSLLSAKYAMPQHKFIVAHVNHGIRPDSYKDQRLVERSAKNYGLRFESIELHLGEKASEALARSKRYQFLENLKDKYEARAIITAHHQDDLIETAIINLIRGTNRKGLSALQTNPGVIRPLLDYPKVDIMNYAKLNNIKWREDSTNTDISYLRNYIRHKILPRLESPARTQLIELINKMAVINRQLDNLIEELLNDHLDSGELDRQWFSSLPHDASREVLAGWLRKQGIRDFDKNCLERLVVSAKVAHIGRHYPVLNGRNLKVKTSKLALGYIER